MKKFLAFLFFGVLFCNFSFAIDLSDYSKEERDQYKKIKKM